VNTVPVIVGVMPADTPVVPSYVLVSVTAVTVMVPILLTK
jgi:hypothetical protein